MNIEATSIADFCTAHSISRAHLYNLMKRGQGPTVMKAGKRTLISNEAAAAWRRAMEERASEIQTRKA
jgi:predicted DNA-binding transcriptional regulator AlpA